MRFAQSADETSIVTTTEDLLNLPFNLSVWSGIMWYQFAILKQEKNNGG